MTTFAALITNLAAFRPHRLARSRTPAFHAGNTGSNPVGDAKDYPRVMRNFDPFSFLMALISNLNTDHDQRLKDPLKPVILEIRMG